MTWTVPPTVITGQLFTAAMWNTYIKDNELHLRALLPDSAGANLPLVASGTTSAAFGVLPDAGMQNQKTNINNPSYTTFAGALAGKSGFFQINNGGAAVADGPVGGGTDYYLLQIRYPNDSIDFRVQIAYYIADNTNTYQRMIVSGTPSAWAKVWNAANDGSGSTLDADTLDGANTGNATGNIPVNNSIISVDLNAYYLQNYTPGNGAGAVLGINNGVLNTSMNADMVDSHHATDITPNNARVWFNSVAELTAAGSHWSRDTATDGRLLVGGDEEGNDAGMALFTPGTNYGAHWFPTNDVTLNVGTLTGLTAAISDPISGDVALLQGTVPAGNVSSEFHDHPATAVTISGAPGKSNPSWFPLMRAGVWGKKA